jgi:RNA polymerase sigma factor (sigma-70 family)
MAPRLSERLLRARPDDRLLQAESDERLVSLARAGHAPAFAAIVERYEPELQAQARRMTRDGRAEDIVQQAFLNAFVALQSGGDVSHLRGWLHQILRNAVIKTRPPAEAPLDEDERCGESLEDLVQRRATAREALTEMSALPERQRDALVSTALWGVPRAHVALNMGLSEGAVRQLVHRARLTVRRAVAALVPYPLMKLTGTMQSGAGAASEVLTPAGLASGGGLLAKFGAVVASGLVASGIAVTQIRHHGHAARPQHVAELHAAVRSPSGAPGAVGGIVAPAGSAVVDRVRLSTHQVAGRSRRGQSREAERGGPRTQGRRRGGASGNASGRRNGQDGNGPSSDRGGGHRTGSGSGEGSSGSAGGSSDGGPGSSTSDSGKGGSGSGEGTSGSTGGPSAAGDGKSGSGAKSGSGDAKSGSGDGSTTGGLGSTSGSSGTDSGSGGGSNGDNNSGSTEGATATAAVTSVSTAGSTGDDSASSHDRLAGQDGSSGSAVTTSSAPGQGASGGGDSGGGGQSTAQSTGSGSN